MSPPPLVIVSSGSESESEQMATLTFLMGLEEEVCWNAVKCTEVGKEREDQSGNTVLHLVVAPYIFI